MVLHQCVYSPDSSLFQIRVGLGEVVLCLDKQFFSPREFRHLLTLSLLIGLPAFLGWMAQRYLDLVASWEEFLSVLPGISTVLILVAIGARFLLKRRLAIYPTCVMRPLEGGEIELYDCLVPLPAGRRIHLRQTRVRIRQPGQGQQDRGQLHLILNDDSQVKAYPLIAFDWALGLDLTRRLVDLTGLHLEQREVWDDAMDGTNC